MKRSFVAMAKLISEVNGVERVSRSPSPLFVHPNLWTEFPHHKRTFTVAIEGNIGSGKSTFLDQFRNDAAVAVFEEPLQSWLNVGGQNLLDLMYHDTKRWGFLFQSYVHLTRIRQYSAPCSKPLRFMERSFLSNRYCFTELWKRNSAITEVETGLLTEWQDYIAEDFVRPSDIDLIIYLRVPPEISYQRLKRRGRTEEDVVPLEFLQSIHELHEDLLIRKTSGAVVCPVVTIDASLPLEKVKSTYVRVRDELKVLSRTFGCVAKA